MNGKQHVALRVGLVVILLMGLLPPHRANWLYNEPGTRYGSNATGVFEPSIGYGPVFESASTLSDKSIDLPLLLTQWGIVASLTGLFVSYLRDARPASRSDAAAHVPK